MKSRLHIIIFAALLALLPSTSKAQIGEYRSDLSIGVNGGYMLSNVGFNPDIPQKFHGGFTAGLTVRYNCEKYFSTICALVGEVNLSQMGWKEDILTSDDQPVVNRITGVEEQYERTLTYVQVPVFARLGWGRERKGFQAFFQVGSQVGFFLNDKVNTNFEHAQRNSVDRIGAQTQAVQDTLDIEHKFDYGIAGGLGLEFSRPKLGHFLLEARYYYGLGDLFGNSKRDYFGRSNNSSIIFKLTYLFDIFKTNNPKIK